MVLNIIEKSARDGFEMMWHGPVMRDTAPVRWLDIRPYQKGKGGFEIFAPRFGTGGAVIRIFSRNPGNFFYGRSHDQNPTQ
jgi:hypothetical protein